ncbi:MAG: LacI family transcriptional regulator [Propionibacteriaceae bacterium]|jgi:LacI family transcriptional regulator|nr:LacI family transcriptional regulator [Propionibacteriaceae bacterium]
MATLKDVAREARVSLSTASRAINGSKDRVVHPELQRRVTEAAQRLNYSPNAAAQAMARGHTTAVGLIVHDIRDPYFSSIAAGVTQAAARHRSVVTLATTSHEHDTEIRLIEAMRRQRVCALVLAGGLNDDEAELAELRTTVASFKEAVGSPVAVIGQDLLDVSTVVVDNHAGARDLAQALRGPNVTRVAILAGPPTLFTARDRAEGFIAGLDSTAEIAAMIHGPFDRDGGFTAMNQALALDPRPDLVFAVNDVMAVGALVAARQAGLTVPTDIAVAGFDDIPTLHDITPALTTARLPLEEMGEAAVRLILADDLIDHARVTINATVVLRESTRR